MRAFSLVTLSPEAFDDFSAHHADGNFQQTSAAGRLRAGQGIEVEYLGVQENGTIVAGALFETHRSRLSTFSVVHDGPLCDYRDRELTEYFMTQLKQHAKAKGSAQMEIVPEMPYCLHDSRGGELPADQGGAPADDAVETLKNLGFMHDGFTIGYTAVPRWRYLKDLTGITDEKSLLKSYDKRTQWSVKRAASMGVHVRELGEDELQVFADMESKRDVLRKKVDTLQTKYDEHPTTKTERQLGEESRNLEAAEKRLAEAAEYAKDGDVLPAAASLFVEHARETVYLFSGSVEKYKPFYASALIQHDAMLHLCVERGVTRYNFYGINGVFDDPEDEGRGVLEFKQGFNGYVEELMGSFVLPVRPLTFKLKTALRKLLRH